MALCECGCGGTPNPGCRFLYQHHNRMIKTRFPDVCACGCGAATAPGKKFRKGHWARTDHAPTSQGPLTPEHRAKISASSKGKPKPRTPEHTAKIAAAKRGKPNVIRDREAWIAKNRAAKLGKKRAPFSEAWKAKLARVVYAHHATRRPTVIEDLVATALDTLGVSYQREAEAGTYHLDFLLPGKIDLECDGAYWHSLPHYISHDQRRDAWLTRHGYIVIRLKESDIRRDAQKLVKDILHHYNIPSS